MYKECLLDGLRFVTRNDLIFIEEDIRDLEKIFMHSVLSIEHDEVRILRSDEPAEHRITFLVDFAFVDRTKLFMIANKN